MVSRRHARSARVEYVVDGVPGDVVAHLVVARTILAVLDAPRRGVSTRNLWWGMSGPPLRWGYVRLAGGYVTPQNLKVEPLVKVTRAHNLRVEPLLQALGVLKPLLKVVAILKVVEALSPPPPSTPRTRGSSMTVCCIGFASQVTVLS